MQHRIQYPSLVRRFWWLMLPGLLLSACLPDPIPIEIEPPNPELVIASQILPDRVMVVAVTRSFSALSYSAENEEDSITNDLLAGLFVDTARVTVSFAGRTEELFSLGSGVYASVNTLQLPNEFYTLSVFDSTTGDMVTAQTQMLPFVPFDTIFPVLIPQAGDTTVALEYTISDPPGDNWYAINVIRQEDDSTEVGIDLNSFFSVGLNVVTQTRLVSDRTFSGSQISERFDLFDIAPSDSVVVTIANISQGYFEYLEAAERAEGLLSQITQEPINRPTNVNGGRGFFNAYFPDVRYFDLSEW
ncbi:MAG: DUF4249 domain-containing protein [Bacteroidota bacterium]